MVDQGKKKLKTIASKDHADVHAKRLRQFRQKLKENNLDSFIVGSPQNKFYLTGWEGDVESGWLLITLNRNYILTDSRYTQQATLETKVFEVTEYDNQIEKFFGNFVRKVGVKSVGFESQHLSVSSFQKLKKFCQKVKFVPTDNFVQELRSIKDEGEIKNIKKAVKIADKTFEYILNKVKPGMTEKEVAWEMEQYIKNSGADGLAWEPIIVASGANSSMAHWGAGDREIKNKDTVLLDFGCVWQGYCSDITRIIFVGQPTDLQKRIYDMVLSASLLGESLISKGKEASLIDKTVKSFLENQTKNSYRHGLGHGVGLEVHELPKLSTQSKSKLEENNTVTIEPGIYIPGWGGIRLEDIGVVKRDGFELLTKSPKNINEVTI